MRPTLGLAGAMLLLGGLVVPGTSAQSGQPIAVVAFGAPRDDNGRLMPEREVWEIPAQINLKFPPMPGVCVSAYQVQLQVDGKPGYASFMVAPSTFGGSVGGPVPAVTTGGETRIHEAKLVTSVTRMAPALAAAEYRVKVVLMFPPMTNGCTLSGGASVHRLTITPDYFAAIDAAAPRVASPDAEGRFLVKVWNFANGPTRVRVDLEAAPGARFATLRPPPEIGLAAPPRSDQQGPPMQEVAIDYQSSSGNGRFTARFTGSYDGPGEFETDVMTIAFTVGAAGVLPGFAHLGAIVAIALAAVATRRRRR